MTKAFQDSQGKNFDQISYFRIANFLGVGGLKKSGRLNQKLTHYFS